MKRLTTDNQDHILGSLNLFYQSWRKAPAFRHGDISHTLLPRKEILQIVA